MRWLEDAAKISECGEVRKFGEWHVGMSIFLRFFITFAGRKWYNIAWEMSGAYFGPNCILVYVGGCKHVAMEKQQKPHCDLAHCKSPEVKTVLGFRREAFKKLGVEVTVFLVSVLWPVACG